MKTIFYVVLFAALISCDTAGTDPVYKDIEIIKEPEVKLDEEDELNGDYDMEDPYDFDVFLDYFDAVDYPFSQKYGTNRISYFDKEILKELKLDYAQEERKQKLSLYNDLVNNWILSACDNIELINFLERAMPNIDDSWYSIQPGVKLKNENNYYLTLNTYEQTSGVNGGYWTVWLLEYMQTGELTQIIKLGREGFYTFVDMVDTEEESYWRRHNNNEMLQFNFMSKNDVKVCQYKWTEIEGDVDSLDMNYRVIKTGESSLKIIIKDQNETCWMLSDSLK